MELRGSRVVVTGGASGIGKAMALRFAGLGASVTVADLDGDAAAAVAASVDGGALLGVECDVRDEAAIIDLIARAEDAFGPIDLFCSNAGVALGGGPEAPDEAWTTSWEVHLMAHVWAARALVPMMIARGGGYLLNTASAAGLLTNIGAAPYSVTKHAAVSFAEWLAITYGDQGIKVSCLCPQGVNTPLLTSGLSEAAGAAVLASGNVLEPADVADAVVEGLGAERFLILPHPEVQRYIEGKAADYDRWLSGMRRLQARL
jgi:NAD(P)-dependent dehydrogenase (short-subunit alcohol dehydrogenase family)